MICSILKGIAVLVTGVWLTTYAEHKDDDQYARTGAKIGTSLRICLPNEYTARHGPAAQPQDTTEQQIVMSLSTQDGIDVSFSSVERTMQLDDYVERILAPKIAFLTADVAYTIMSAFEGRVSN